jgi:hypothetical protein
MVLRSADFRAPKKITQSDFDELCKRFKIPSSHRSDTKRRLDELVRAFGEWMTNERLQPDRKSDRERLKNALSNLEKAATQIDHLGPSGRRAIQAISDSVAPMLAAQWLNEQFPDDDYAPQRSRLPLTTGLRPPLHTPLRGRKYFIEEESLGARHEFVQQRPVRTTSAMLGEIKKGLVTALLSLDLQPGAKGGRGPLTYRRYLIINLAEIWETCGNQIPTSNTSDFTDFCDGVAASIGWPIDGMSAAIPKVIKKWRNLPQKIRQ